MPTREYEYREVRRLLGNPIEQKPTPDLIISALIREEQFLYNRLNGTGKPWTNDSVTLTTVAGNPTYTLSPGIDNGTCDVNLGSAFGKALYVYRNSGSQIIPIPFTDQNSELLHPGGQMEKIAFFRTSTGAQKARIFPTPQTAGTVYVIVYATGEIDPSTFKWCDTPIMPEWSGLRCLTAAATLLIETGWDGYDRKDADARRIQFEKSLTTQIARQEIEFGDYIRNPQHEPPIDTIDGWYTKDYQEDSSNWGVPSLTGTTSDGPTGNELLSAVYFVYNDTSPKVLYTPTADWIITSITLVVLTAFNATGAKASIGTSSLHESLLAEDDSDLSVAVTYQSEPALLVSKDNPIMVFLTPGTGGTAGRAMVFIEYAPAA